MTNNHNNVLYTGVTNNLMKRACEHKNKAVKGFKKWPPKTGQYVRCKNWFNLSPTGGQDDQTQKTKPQFKV